MRRFFLILLVALLPLRAWAGDAMSVAMSVTMAPGSGAAHSAAEMPADCGMQMQSAGAAAVDAASEADGSGSALPATSDGCNACALCFAATPLPSPIGTFARARPVTPVPGGAFAFRSRDFSPSPKPPIS